MTTPPLPRGSDVRAGPVERVAGVLMIAALALVGVGAIAHASDLAATVTQGGLGLVVALGVGVAMACVVNAVVFARTRIQDAVAVAAVAVVLVAWALMLTYGYGRLVAFYAGGLLTAALVLRAVATSRSR